MSIQEPTGMIELDPHARWSAGACIGSACPPDDPTRCIKIVVAGTGNENRREQAYYTGLARRGFLEMLPKFHGLVHTNLGEGAVFDLVRDYDNRISLTSGITWHRGS